MQHQLVENTLTTTQDGEGRTNGILARCTCGWSSSHFSSLAASAAFLEHQEAAARRADRERAQMAKSKRDSKPCGWSRVERYKAIYKPRCNFGAGCRRCWDKWHIVNVRGGRDDRPRDAEGATRA